MPSYDDVMKKNKSHGLITNNDVKANDSLLDFQLRLKHSQDLVCSIAFDGQLLEFNSVFSTKLGYSKEELLLKSFYSIFLSDENESVEKEFAKLKTGAPYLRVNYSLITNDGQLLSSTWVVNYIDCDSGTIYCTGYELFDKEAVPFESMRLDTRFRALVENNNGIITVFSPDSKILYRSSSSQRINGYTDAEYEKLSDDEYYHPDFVGLIKEKISESLSKPNVPVFISFQVKHKEGHYIWLEGVITNMLHDTNIQGVIANFRDVTESKNTMLSLSKERDRFAKIAATSSGLIYSMRYNDEGSLHFSYTSDALEETFGFKYNEIENNSNKFLDLIHEGDIEVLLSKIKLTKEQLVPLKMTYRYFHPVKCLVWHEVNSLPVVEEDGAVVCHGTITDITKSIVAQEKVRKANWLYQFISQINQMIVRIPDEHSLFQEVCTIAVECGHFKMSWIGLIDEESQTIKPAMIAGEDHEYLSKIKVISTQDDKPEGMGPIGIAVRSGSSVVCNDIENDIMMLPWREQALERGYSSVMALPIRNGKKIIGAIIFYSGDKNFFDAEEIALLEEATEDVSFALEIQSKEVSRRKAEEAIYQSEKRYHTLTEVSPVGIFRTDKIGSTTYVNSRWCEISGFTFQMAMGNGWFDAVHPEDKTSILSNWNKTAASKEISSLEYRFLKSDGQVVWVMGHAIPERNSENEVVGYVGTITDITDRKLSEEKFKKINKKMEAIIDAIPDLMFEIGLDGTFYDYYSQRNDLLLLAPEKFIGKNIFEVLPEEAAKASMLALKEASEHGVSTGIQYSLDLPLGKLWFELSIAPMELSLNKDDLTHFICLARDITTAKKGDEALLISEQRYRGLLDNLEAGVVVHSPDNKILMHNSKALELLGMHSENLAGRFFNDTEWSFINEDGTDMVLENYPVSKILSSKKAINNYTMGKVHSDTGEIKWVLVSGYPTFNQFNEISEVVISFIDVSDRKAMVTEISKAKELAEAANKAKTDFLANMSHEIRTPLNGIIGFTNLLMESELNNSQFEYMSTVNQSANSLMHIVNDVLDFAKIESGKLELDEEEFDLFELFEQVIHLFKYSANLKDIGLLLNVDESIPQYLVGDVLRLKQILVNLLSNAIKFTEKGEVRLEVMQDTAVNEDYCLLTFSVKDTGIGIKAHNDKKIFSSFVQEDSSTSRKFGGTGLGLAISNQLLELMDSALNLESTYGAGSNFYFTIKLKKVSESKTINHKNSNISKNSSFVNMVSKKILIVEDNKINMFLAKTLVKRILPNCIIMEATDGVAAVESYKEAIPDLILMDIQMPNKNGYEAATEIRAIETNSKTPIIAVTAGILIGEKEKCFDSGMDDYMPKPIIIDDLERVLSTWLKN
jgi:PAS domain S-box-containing protein